MLEEILLIWFLGGAALALPMAIFAASILRNDGHDK